MFEQFLVRPLFNLLVVIYNILPVADLGVATVVFTVVVWGILLYPLSRKMFRSQDALAKLQPELKRIQEHHANDKEAQAKATMALYRERGVNPFGGCLIIIVQLPIFIALFTVFRRATDPTSLALLYHWVSRPEAINAIFLGFLNLAQPNVVAAVLTGVAQFIQSKLTVTAPTAGDRGQDVGRILSMQATYVFPVLITIAALRFPAGLTLYWFTATTLQILQRLWVKRQTQRQVP